MYALYAPQTVSKITCALLLMVLMAPYGAPRALAQTVSSSPGFLGQKVIVLDPGHGGHDHGAVGPSGLTEKSVALTVARELKKTLEGAYAVHLTRNGDYWLNIEKRTALANHRRADLFISLHAGGSSHHTARGAGVFFYGPTPGQELALEEEGPVMDTGERLRQWDHIQSLHTTKSSLLANLVHSQLLAVLNPMDRGVHAAPCLVLRGADMPAILVEVGYVSHPAEEKELRDPLILSAFAEAIGEGIRDFFRQTSGCVNEKAMIEEMETGRGAAW